MAHHGKRPFDGQMGNKEREEIARLIGDREAMPLSDLSKEGGAVPASDEEFRRNQLTRALQDVTNFKGALGMHSQGKLTPQDEGDVQFRVGAEKDKVVLDFGTPVTWVGMDAQQAADLASSLMKWAKIVGRKNGETITVNLNAP